MAIEWYSKTGTEMRKAQAPPIEIQADPVYRASNDPINKILRPKSEACKHLHTTAGSKSLDRAHRARTKENNGG